MNIMLAVTNMTAANGGVTTHIVDLCRELTRENHRIVLVSDKNECDYWNKIHELEQNEKFKFVSLDLKNVQTDKRKLLNTIFAIRKIVKVNRIDIIHAHSQCFCVIGAAVKILTGVPYVWTNHIDEMANPGMFKRILTVFCFPIISVSTDLKKLLVDEYRVSENRITVVNNGIHINDFAPLSKEEQNNLRDKWNLQGKYTVGLLARMTYGKGHKYLLQAIDRMQVQESIKDIKVLIAGKLHENERGYLNELEEYCQQHHIDMKFLGFQNPRDVFGICDISVLPSIYEGFGITCIESLAMGCPVIRSNTPGWSDLADVTKVFEKKNVDELTEDLLYAYYHQAEMRTLAKNGKKIVEERFTIEHQAEETIKVYKRYKKKSLFVKR